jgi:integrase
MWLERTTTSDPSLPIRAAPARGPLSSVKGQIKIGTFAMFLNGVGGKIGTYPSGFPDIIQAFQSDAQQDSALGERSLYRRITTITKLAGATVRHGWSGDAPPHFAPVQRSWKSAGKERLLTAPEIERLLLAPDDSARGVRDAALLHLLLETGFHRAELCALNRDQFRALPEPDSQNPQGALLSIADKGDTTSLKLTSNCARAVMRYLASTEDPVPQSGKDVPLFRSLDRRPQHNEERLTVDGIYSLVVKYGKMVGLAVTPRLLRRTVTVRDRDLGEPAS